MVGAKCRAALLMGKSKGNKARSMKQLLKAAEGFNNHLQGYIERIQPFISLYSPTLYNIYGLIMEPCSYSSALPLPCKSIWLLFFYGRNFFGYPSYPQLRFSLFVGGLLSSAFYSPFLSPKKRVCCAGFDHWREVLSLYSTRQVMFTVPPCVTVMFCTRGY